PGLRPYHAARLRTAFRGNGGASVHVLSRLRSGQSRRLRCVRSRCRGNRPASRGRSHLMRGKVAIAGVGNTVYGKHPGRDKVDLIVEAAAEAIGDAGISKDEIDGVF